MSCNSTVLKQSAVKFISYVRVKCGAVLYRIASGANEPLGPALINIHILAGAPCSKPVPSLRRCLSQSVLRETLGNRVPPSRLLRQGCSAHA